MTYNFSVHSNEITCRKRVSLGLDSVNHKLLGVQCHVLILSYLYASIYAHHFYGCFCNIREKNCDKISQVSLWVEEPKPNVTEVDVMFILIFGIFCLLIYLYFCNLRMMSILICHVFHNQRTPFS